MHLSKHRASGVCLAMLLWLPAASFAADLDLDQALQTAERYSAELSANQHQINARQNMADSATQLPDPQLRFGVENLPLGGNNGSRLTREEMTMQRIGVMQTYVSSSKRESKAQTFRVEADSLRSNSETLRARLQRETAQAWLELALSQKSLQEVKSLVTESQRQIALQKASVAAGSEVSSVLDARLTLAAMQDRLADAERDVRIARVRITRLTGLSDVNVRGALPRFERLPASPEELKNSLHQHPEMQQAQRDAELAKARSAQSAVAAIPDVGVEVYYAKRGNDYDDMAGVMVTVDLPLFKSKRQDKDYAADVARTQEARDNVLLAAREHQVQLDTLIAQYQAAQSRWQRQNQDVLPLQQQRSKLIQAQYQSGGSDLAAVLEARRALLESNIAAQDAAREMAQIWAAIRYLIPQGKPLQ
ncbi:outer membrane protein TolC|uniref:Outer membrane protein TolC n=1 Tax=Brenneria salicis ATCC 15712 = DSM 30166 TaxID=714314 RepID=A0A366IB22_9GAMM|nr:TolC family protein [Brenneria salicis]NMN92181.1 outer membrane protein TolC [Brenneria salicis ATCC 15712 = DSM 30166]RBP67515.1 outer membrane protein TolC [Brenneria salicis ATCC 15712 = DSM 30166]RLM32498.1 heavy metal RND transporter [Brenneria salicis ATCC 15712 = DSM 30166]